MFCEECGKKLADDSRFCENCGHPVKMTAATPVVTPPKKEKTKAEKKQDWQDAKRRYKEDVAAKKAAKKKNASAGSGKKGARVFVKILLAVLIVAILGVGIYFGLRGLGIIGGENQERSKATQDETKLTGGSIGIHNAPSGDMPAEYAPERIDADEYFRDHSQIVNTISAANAGRTEAQAYKNLTDRGFSQQPITVQYDMSGNYFAEKEISSGSSDKHPMYTTAYTTDSGDVWMIYEINGAVFASPLSYNANRSGQVPVMISETETITSYDGTLNKFYVTKPNEDSLQVKVVGRIDTSTLETLTAGRIDAL